MQLAVGNDEQAACCFRFRNRCEDRVVQLLRRRRRRALADSEVLCEPVDDGLDMSLRRKLGDSDLAATDHEAIGLWLCQNVFEQQLVVRKRLLERLRADAQTADEKGD